MAVDLTDFIWYYSTGGKRSRKYRANCNFCKKDRGYLQKRYADRPCESCGKKKSASEDFIWVTSKAGIRGEQRVRKVRMSCESCGKDRGYLHQRAKSKCASCSKKERAPYIPGHNFVGSRKFIAGHCTRSTYESFFMEYLIDNNINFQYEPTWFTLSDGTRYLPDFYIEDTDTYVEIKGRMRKSDETKLALFQTDFPAIRLEVVALEKLKELGYEPNKYKLVKNLTVKGHAWKLVVLGNRDFDSRYDSDGGTEGICLKDRRIIHIRKDAFNLTTIKHELGHAFYAETCTSSADLQDVQVEEVFCDILACHGEEITKIARDTLDLLVPKMQARWGIRVTE